MPPSDPASLLAAAGVIPVLTIEHLREAPPLAKALRAGGVSMIEVTLRTPLALEAVRILKAEAPDIVVGVGTVTHTKDAEAAVKAGAQFLVSPGTPPDLAAALASAPVPALPGCATVSEALTLRARGFQVLKFFPAEACGGVSWLRAVAAPLPDVLFCPTGGIDAGNAGDYLSLANVAAIGGSWMAPRQAIAAGEYATVTRLAGEAMAIARRR